MGMINFHFAAVVLACCLPHTSATWFSSSHEVSQQQQHLRLRPESEQQQKHREIQQEVFAMQVTETGTIGMDTDTAIQAAVDLSVCYKSSFGAEACRVTDKGFYTVFMALNDLTYFLNLDQKSHLEGCCNYYCKSICGDEYNGDPVCFVDGDEESWNCEKNGCPVCNKPPDQECYAFDYCDRKSGCQYKLKQKCKTPSPTKKPTPSPTKNSTLSPVQVPVQTQVQETDSNINGIMASTESATNIEILEQDEKTDELIGETIYEAAEGLKVDEYNKVGEEENRQMNDDVNSLVSGMEDSFVNIKSDQQSNRSRR